MSSLRPEIDLLHDLGKQFFRWRKLYTGDIETNDLNIKTNTTTINVLTKLNELENLIGQGGGGSGTVTSINSISPDQNGNVLLDSININSSISPTNYIKDPNTDALDSHLKGIDNKLPIIASGGIFKGEDAQAKLNAGASLVQIWTGFIYEGPSMVKNICIHLAKHK